MKLVERRMPLGWPVIIAGTAFAGLLIYALYTGDAFVPGRRGTPSRHILRVAQPDEFHHFIKFYTIAAFLGLFFGFLRVVPVENAIRDIKIRAKEQIARKGYDRDAAPWWGYLILVVAVGLVVWIGKMTMYSE